MKRYIKKRKKYFYVNSSYKISIIFEHKKKLTKYLNTDIFFLEFYKMSDSEDEGAKIQEFKEVAEEIKKCKKNPETSGMFVSGWDDADQQIDVVKDPTGTFS